MSFLLTFGKAFRPLLANGRCRSYSCGVQSDLRAVLQYVPSFRGRIFVVVLNAGRMTELALAEALLDLTALQQVGVQLVVISTGTGEARIDQLLTDGELKWQAVGLEAEDVSAILNRGQLALIESPDLPPLGDAVVGFAMKLGAFKLISLVPKLAEGGTAISREEAQRWSGPEEALFHRAAEVCGSGIPRVHLLDEAHQGVLMDELFSNEGVGVMVYADDYLSVRPIAPDDISELLAMVGRSMRDAHLVPRTYEEIENSLTDFLVLTIDDNVVGCVALHLSEEPPCAEVACLYVKQSHGGRGYGQLLVEAAEKRALGRGVPWVFALSTRAVEFFTENLGYEACPIEAIPAERQARLRESGRESRVIRKVLV